MAAKKMRRRRRSRKKASKMDQSRGASSSDAEDGEDAQSESQRPNIGDGGGNKVGDVMKGNKGAMKAAYGSSEDEGKDGIEESDEKDISETGDDEIKIEGPELRQGGGETPVTEDRNEKSAVPPSHGEKQDEGLAVSFKSLCKDDSQIVRIFNLIPHDVYTGWKEQRGPGCRAPQNDSIRDDAKRKKASIKGKKLNQKTGRRELQRKLEGKIAQMRAARLADDKDAEALRKSRKRKREEKRPSSAKKRRVEAVTNKEGRTIEGGDEANRRGFSSSGKSRKDGEIEFGVVRGFDEELRKPSKIQRKNLKSQLRTAEAVKLKEDELKGGDTGEAEKALNRMGIEKALLKATGVIVKDDPKRIKQSMRREAKKKEKSRRQWEQRKKEELEEQAKRQERRKKNLSERKADKKMRKKRGRV